MDLRCTIPMSVDPKWRFPVPACRPPVRPSLCDDVRDAPRVFRRALAEAYPLGPEEFHKHNNNKAFEIKQKPNKMCETNLEQTQEVADSNVSARLLFVG